MLDYIATAVLLLIVVVVGTVVVVNDIERTRRGK